VAEGSEKTTFECDGGFCTLPTGIINSRDGLCALHGIPSGRDVEVRVRAKSDHGWGPWSEPSERMSTLSSTMPGPAAGAVTANSIELRWRPLLDTRYGKLVSYAVYQGQEPSREEQDTFKSSGMHVDLDMPTQLIYDGRLCRAVATSLQPATTYGFRVVTTSAFWFRSVQYVNVVRSVTTRYV
jgi:hypothetical protein